MEGDSKICVDGLNSCLSSIEWSISNLLFYVFELSKGFVQRDFSLVRREVNCVAYALTKFATAHRLFGFCDKHSLPLVVWSN